VTYSKPARALQKPRLAELPRGQDRISYLALDRAAISQDRTGVIAALAETEDHGPAIARLPVASLSVLLLGQGCSITTPALATMHRHGCTVIVTTGDGISGICAARPLASRSTWIEAQARLVSDPSLRLAAARTLYSHQFPGLPLPGNAPLKVLRGIEGKQVRDAYRRGAQAAGLKGWKRESDSAKASDPVNPLLNLGNAILYAAAASACLALGLSPALGVIHSGHASSFLFDLADLHKTRSTIPYAFAAISSTDPESSLRKALRSYLHTNRVFEHLLQVCDEIFGELTISRSERDTLVDEYGAVPGMTNYEADAALAGMPPDDTASRVTPSEVPEGEPF